MKTKFFLVIFSVILFFSSYSFCTPPSFIAITSPQDGAFVTNIVLIEAQLTQVPQARSVKFYIDDILAGEDYDPPYQYSWDTTSYSDGQHQIYASILQASKRPVIEKAPPILDSSKITVTVDNSPPLTPIVTDDGAYTSSLTGLHASWTSQDPHSGIIEYLYSIGTEPGKTDLVDWTSSDTTTEITLNNLTLTQGITYYFNIKAKNGVGLFSQTGTSDGIIANDGITLLINITSPKENSLLNTSPITVEGTVSNPQAQVLINNYPATLIGQSFSCSLTLDEGSTIINAKAIFNTEVAWHRIRVILDTTPPAINILIPDKDSTTRSNIIYGRVSEDTESLTLNGQDVQLLENSYFFTKPSLTEDINTLNLQATDKAGNLNRITLTFTYDTTTPKVTITLPLDNSEINTSPIKVEGTNTQDIKFIMVNSQTAIIDNTNFTAEGVNLNSPKTIITASGYDENNNKFSDSILINSPQLANYEIEKLSGDTDESDPNRPQAGLEHTLAIKLKKNNSPAPNKEIQFKVTQGNGTLSYNSIFTDINGEAQVILTLDTNSDITNQVECFPTSNPLVKTTFSIDTKPGQPSILTKITDESITPVPGATIPLIVRLTDQYNNPNSDETINFQVTQGAGTLSSPTATTNFYGEAKVNLTCPDLGLALTQVNVLSSTISSVTTTFNITTSAPLTVTIDDIINKVNLNDSKIQDIKADITVTSNAPFLPATMQLKIWQKQDKQKVEEISPNPQVKIRPISSQILQMNREIISYNLSTDVYVIKSKLIGQSEEYPYDLDHIDYQRGVIIKTERHFKVQQDLENLYVIEYLDFLQFNDVWGFQKIKETMYDGNLKEEYYIIKEYSNIQINTGIPDSEFN
ncbi:MAG: hypothetical protein AMJ78_02555 [Omnitrophica WOR_2 bacterium SM23_29]|nr:MAG: hypothetical protein AMJ78_02555 [Omnitrophica WOR_2 bacterium SM23_29]